MFIFGNRIWHDFKKYLIVNGKNGLISDKSKNYKINENPFKIIQKFVEEEKGIKLGYISYNLSRFIENLKIGEDDLNIPDCILVSVDPEKSNLIEDERNQEEPIEINETQDRYEKEKFIRAIEEAKKYIYRGDIYQVNLSRRIEFETEENPYDIFSRYIGVQKIKFPAFFNFSPFANFCIGSGSMEIFLQKQQAKIRECPIKGTRKIPNGADEETINKISEELRSDEKELAENLMIVDMVRNDLGKICKNVKVKRLFDVERYSTLLHLVSEVEGEIENKVGLSEILIATFPPASVTGAPKKSAMQIIEKLEGKRRGPYCGAIMKFEENGDFTMLVSIRIFLHIASKVYYWTGCGIVWDSDPYKEWEESITKTKAFIKALFSTKNSKQKMKK
ncbi:MAG: anthranilate synthase component I family protein [bacterium]|nr:anthranilate synthase component I family protein [bacterium]